MSSSTDKRLENVNIGYKLLSKPQDNFNWFDLFVAKIIQKYILFALH